MASSTSALAWLWVIEALAGSKQVDASVLRELVKKVPEITSDLGKDAREMIYFRVLDHLVSQQGGRNESVSPAPISEKEFDPSESCENVVARMLHEGTNDAEMYKLQLQNFVTQKRIMLPKCALQKLKDAILEGNNPAFVSLKARSGLSTSCKSNKATGSSEGQIVAKEKNSISPNTENLNGQTVAKGKNSTSENSENLNGQTVAKENNLTSPNMEIFNGQTVAKGINSTTSNSGSMNDFSQEKCQHILTPPKRDTCEIGSNDRALRSPNVSSNSENGVDTNSLVTKKLKHDASLTGQAVSHECQATVRDISAEALVDELELNPLVSERKDGENQAHKSTCYETNTIVEKSQPTPSNVVPRVKSHSNEFPLEPQHATDGSSERICPSGSDGFQGERAHIAARKSSFLSSQCTFTQDSLADYFTKVDICTKCEKGGDLLICSAYACPIVVHERCLGAAPNFDDNGKFLCPFCSYSRATSEYLEIKENALLVRKDLAVFMGSGKEQRPNRCSKKSTRLEHNQ